MNRKVAGTEIQKFFTYLFDGGQAGIFERATELSEIPPETEHITEKRLKGLRRLWGDGFDGRSICFCWGKTNLHGRREDKAPPL
jgi:hypothetical protein